MATNTTAIVDRSTLALAEVKSYLKIDSASFDTQLIRLLLSAKQQADLYCSNPFQDADGNDLDIPEAVEQWCLEWIAYKYHRPALNLQSVNVQGVGSSRWGVGPRGGAAGSSVYDDLLPFKRKSAYGAGAP